MKSTKHVRRNITSSVTIGENQPLTVRILEKPQLKGTFKEKIAQARQ